MPTRDFAKGECRHCAGHLEFPAAAVGQTIPCPHCGQPTVLAGPVPSNKVNGARRIGPGLSVAVLLVAAGVAGALWWKPKANQDILLETKPVPMVQSTTQTVSAIAPVAAPEPQP